MAEASTNPTAPAMSTNDRLIFALRQSGILAVALLVAGVVTDRLRPLEAIDRDISSTAFFWAIVVWAIVLLFNAVAFDHTQIAQLERGPLVGGLVAGALVLLVGLISFDSGPIGRRLVYLVANALGVAMFWWAVFALATLVIRWLSADSEKALLQQSR